MCNKKVFLLSFLLVLLVFSFLVLAAPAFAKYGLDETAKAAKLDIYSTSLPTLIGNVIGAILSLVAVIFFGLMIYGGFMWMTAHGKEEQSKSALETIMAAVIGIIIVLGAYAITSFVFKSVGPPADSGKTNVPELDTCEESADCEYNEECIEGKCVESFPGEEGCCIAEDKLISIIKKDDNSDQDECMSKSENLGKWEEDLDCTDITDSWTGCCIYEDTCDSDDKNCVCNDSVVAVYCSYNNGTPVVYSCADVTGEMCE